VSNDQKIKVIDFNTLGDMTKVYRFNQAVRWITISLGLVAFICSLYMIVFIVNAESSKFVKILPFIVLFFTSMSFIKHFFSINTITFRKDAIIFGYILRKSIKIYWHEIKKMEFVTKKSKVIRINYEWEGKKREFDLQISFPNMLEIVNSIAVKCPDIEYDEFLRNILIIPEK